MKNYFMHIATTALAINTVAQCILLCNMNTMPAVNGFTFLPQRTSTSSNTIGGTFTLTDSSKNTAWTSVRTSQSNPFIVLRGKKKSKDESKAVMDTETTSDDTADADAAVNGLDGEKKDENLDIDSLVDDAVEAAAAEEGEEKEQEEKEDDEQTELDKEMMKLAIQMARSR